MLQEILSGSGRDVQERHLDAEFLDGTWVQPSFLAGGIPVVERVEIEDITEGYSSDEQPDPSIAASIPENLMSSTVQAILRTSKHERDALHSARKKLGDVLSFLRKKGFSEEQVLAELKSDGFCAEMPNRDEFGLPKVHKVDTPIVAQQLPVNSPVSASGFNPLKDKMKGIIQEEAPVQHTLPDVLPAKAELGSQPPLKSWSQVVNDPETSPTPVKFDFIQASAGSTKISPPIEVLKQGNEKFKNCLIGVFSKGYLQYSKVMDFARKNWSHKGLIHVSQKDSHTFIFKFREENDVNSILARGTWFIERRPLILHLWGSSNSQKTHLPLWVKFEKVPDCYWTREGLSWLASSIGTPLCADDSTSKLEVLPFAKMCVNYKIGDDLPTCLEVETLDPGSELITTSQVLVSYPVKPLVCSACKSLGHLIGACPKVTRHWVRKDKADSQTSKAPGTEAVVGNSVSNTTVADIADSPITAIPTEAKAPEPANSLDANHSNWQEVKRKKSSTQVDNPSLSAESTLDNKAIANSNANSSIAAHSLPLFSALSRTLSKSQRKKARKSGGKHSPSKH